MTADRHPDVEHLDAYADGGLSASAVELHVRGCPQCSETVTALRRVRRDLAALASVTMPEDVATRLHAALIIEQDRHRPNGPDSPDTLEAGSHGPAPQHSVKRLRPLRPPHLRPRAHPRRPGRMRGRGHPGLRSSRPGQVPSWLSAAAACLTVVVAVVGFMGVLGRHTGRTSAGEAVSQVVAPLSADITGSSEGTRQRAGASSTSGTAVSAAAGDGDATASAPAIFAHTGHLLNVADIPHHTLDLLSGRIKGTFQAPLRDYGGAAAGPPAAVASLVTELTQPDLRTCYLSLATQTGGNIIALDLVAFDGQPAVLVVLSVPTDPDELRVIVLDERCGVTNIAAALWYSTTTSRR
ncbi:anti-sigma factor family protein [Protofrankia symbiont of Coriaria ruscifolia]|uniref:anti-sigma factor family protein n=1 Tax=Protofrankia symbiont of Coriaria ruscifolia TaxID=1306542 RepID=UPI001040EA25|nr:zf-HC2 domain-containing protein [Protofrankia symbiont of Coriaria ruscifolia]